jgi:hypothetical protein
MIRIVDILVGDQVGNQLHMTARIEILQNGKDSTISKISEYKEPVQVEIYENWLFVIPEAINVLKSMNFGNDGRGRTEAVAFLYNQIGKDKSCRDVMVLD